MASTKPRPKLFIPIGIPGSGKSTWSAAILDATVVSTDSIRERIHPGVQHDASVNHDVFAWFHASIDAHLKRGQHVIADATNLHDYARDMLRDIAQWHGASVHYIFFTNIAQAIERNQSRGRVVPDSAMLGFVGQYEKARQDVLREPFDTLTYISSVQ